MPHPSTAIHHPRYIVGLLLLLLLLLLLKLLIDLFSYSSFFIRI
jgi:hypothetical protein